MVSESMVRNRAEVTPYEHTNEKMNSLMDDETVWIVQGRYGRKPIIADTAEEALDRYILLNHVEDEESNDFEFEEVE